MKKVTAVFYRGSIMLQASNDPAGPGGRRGNAMNFDHLDESSLLQQKSSAAPFFHVSLDGNSFDECWQPFLGGLFRAPIPVYYRASFEPAEIILAIGGNSMIHGWPKFPAEVKEAILGLIDQYGLNSFDFFWLVTDVSKLMDRNGHELNLSHHAWYFPDDIFPEVIGGKRVEVTLDAGIFSYSGSQVFPITCFPTLLFTRNEGRRL